MDLQAAFYKAKAAYPDRFVSGHRTEWASPLFDDEPEEEIQVPHTWQFVDARAVSGMGEYTGMLILQEHRPGCRTPFNHWGFMVPKSELQRPQPKE